MADKSAKPLIIGIVVVVVAITAVLAVMQGVEQARTREVTGTIAALDPAARTATLEIVHPKSGRLIELSGKVPPGCDIRINGAPAEMADLNVGELVLVEGTIHPDMTVTANWVRVTRATTTAPASPATQPAAEP